MGMAAEDQRRVLDLRELCDLATKARSVDGDVEDQDLEQRRGTVADVQRHDVGKIGSFFVDVSADGHDLGVRGEALEHGQITDIPGVHDQIRMELFEPMIELRMGTRMGVCDHDDAKRTTIDGHLDGTAEVPLHRLPKYVTLGGPPESGKKTVTGAGIPG